VVLGRVGGRYRVFSHGELLAASLRGRMKQGHEERVLVGDRVRLAIHEDGSATIEGVGQRESLLRRRMPGGRRGVRAVVANVDQVMVVGATREPDWDPYLMDRFLAVSEANQLQAVLVINKCDLMLDRESLARPYRTSGYQVVETSTRTGLGLDGLRQQLRARTSVFTGPTGVGKSSLLNALQPGLSLRTAQVSARSGTGRHTTVMAEMHPLAPEGFVVDTPGLRDIGLWGLALTDVVNAFPEIAKAGSGCRFDNCRHLGEPGCAVEPAVAREEVAASRLTSYRQLLREALEAARPWA
jgi:ribosome biogenesis GTPase